MKDKTIAIILCLVLGPIGAHKFYLNERKKGWLYLIFFWSFIPGIFSIFDFFKLIFMKKEDFDKKYNLDVIK